MKRGLYIRLAATGISKNKKLYYPYILTCICMVMMYYIVSFLCRSEEFRKVPGAETLQSVLGFGVIVIGLFSLIFLYYTNSFLIRRRQKEFGLYNILGMGKRNLVKILLRGAPVKSGGADSGADTGRNGGFRIRGRPGCAG